MSALLQRLRRLPEKYVLSQGLRHLEQDVGGEIVQGSTLCRPVNADNYFAELYPGRLALSFLNRAVGREMERLGVTCLRDVDFRVYVPTNGTATPHMITLQGYAQLQNGLIVPNWVARGAKESRPFEGQVREIVPGYAGAATDFNSKPVLQ
ncbi:MAG: hypothetical protein OXR66_01880 [Candidatus Woesearchaeota archaeon]|nr:hypothetical protein [Candidatus Woesearchaeota archaeon]